MISMQIFYKWTYIAMHIAASVVSHLFIAALLYVYIPRVFQSHPTITVCVSHIVMGSSFDFLTYVYYGKSCMLWSAHAYTATQ